MAEGLVATRVTVERGRREVLRAVGFEAAHGEVSCVLGPNGAGKSTLLRALAGLLSFRGEVTLDGTPLSRLDARERARRLAFVPQRSALTASLSVRTVVSQGRYAHTGGLGRPGAADRRAVVSALSRTDVAELAHRRFDRLSAGEQRRVLLARALATEAPVILLDEPTAALDVRHALELHALLRALADDGYCVVVVLHELDAARRFTDRATLLRDGEVVTAGPSAEVVQPGPVREVYGVELLEDAALGFRLGGAS
ncbi:MAG TPA: ABC transporter ATP-binding protein [Sandaracinaceae bacterium LLY-WYZ-13_1]|nr:ABC transporter ATP-binding protein [Sandaracinaceae bacterium LLY-WYZ-13_1]